MNQFYGLIQEFKLFPVDDDIDDQVSLKKLEKNLLEFEYKFRKIFIDMTKEQLEESFVFLKKQDCPVIEWHPTYKKKENRKKLFLKLGYIFFVSVYLFCKIE